MEEDWSHAPYGFRASIRGKVGKLGQLPGSDGSRMTIAANVDVKPCRKALSEETLIQWSTIAFIGRKKCRDGFTKSCLWIDESKAHLGKWPDVARVGDSNGRN